MEASQHFQDTHIEEESSSPGNASIGGDIVQFNITAFYVPEIGSGTPGGAR
jgi:hypothetical protein